MNSDALRKLAALKLDAGQMAAVLEIFADQQEAEERRLFAQRERKARQRAGQSRDSHATVTEPERDTEQQKENPQTPKEKIEPPKENTPLRGVQKKRGLRLPSDFVMPDEWRDWAIQRGLPPDRVPIEFEKLTNWAANAGAKGAKVDWFKAWRNWVIGAIDNLPRQRAGPAPRINPTLAAARQLMEKLDAVPTSETQGNFPPPRLLAFGNG